MESTAKKVDQNMWEIQTSCLSPEFLTTYWDEIKQFEAQLNPENNWGGTYNKNAFPSPDDGIIVKIIKMRMRDIAYMQKLSKTEGWKKLYAIYKKHLCEQDNISKNTLGWALKDLFEHPVFDPKIRTKQLNGNFADIFAGKKVEDMQEYVHVKIITVLENQNPPHILDANSQINHEVKHFLSSEYTSHDYFEWLEKNDLAKTYTEFLIPRDLKKENLTRLVEGIQDDPKKIESFFRTRQAQELVLAIIRDAEISDDGEVQTFPPGSYWERFSHEILQKLFYKKLPDDVRTSIGEELETIQGEKEHILNEKNEKDRLFWSSSLINQLWASSENKNRNLSPQAIQTYSEEQWKAYFQQHINFTHLYLQDIYDDVLEFQGEVPKEYESIARVFFSLLPQPVEMFEFWVPKIRISKKIIDSCKGVTQKMDSALIFGDSEIARYLKSYISFFKGMK